MIGLLGVSREQRKTCVDFMLPYSLLTTGKLVFLDNTIRILSFIPCNPEVGLARTSTASKSPAGPSLSGE